MLIATGASLEGSRGYVVVRGSTVRLHSRVSANLWRASCFLVGSMVEGVMGPALDLAWEPPDAADLCPADWEWKWEGEGGTLLDGDAFSDLFEAIAAGFVPIQVPGPDNTPWEPTLPESPDGESLVFIWHPPGEGVGLASYQHEQMLRAMIPSLAEGFPLAALRLVQFNGGLASFMEDESLAAALEGLLWE